MPSNGGLSSLGTRNKLYKQPTGGWFDVAGVCFLCQTTTLTPGVLCAGCRADFPLRDNLQLRREIPFVDDAFAAFRYEFPVTEVVKAAKFDADLGAMTALATAFSDKFLAAIGELDVLLPVPLLPWRFLRRGFNQAGELARALSRRTGYPVRHDVLRRRQVWGLAQSRLDAATRRKNVRDAFRVSGEVAGLRVAIVDDVITTGATCAALAQLLRQAGACRVLAIAAAATSLRREDHPD